MSIAWHLSSPQINLSSDCFFSLTCQHSYSAYTVASLQQTILNSQTSPHKHLPLFLAAPSSCSEMSPYSAHPDPRTLLTI